MKRLVFEGAATAIALNLVVARRQRFVITEVGSQNYPRAVNLGIPDEYSSAEYF